LEEIISWEYKAHKLWLPLVTSYCFSLLSTNKHANKTYNTKKAEFHEIPLLLHTCSSCFETDLLGCCQTKILLVKAVKGGRVWGWEVIGFVAQVNAMVIHDLLIFVS